MNVETYEVNEVTVNGIEENADPEALALIESLGLNGQKRFVKGNENEDTKTRVPYRLMTTTEYRVYSIVLPDRIELSKYDGQMIPLRVLQIAAHAKETQMFKRIEIWHDEGKDDPLLVGTTSDYEYSRPDQRQCFILARWGNILLPMDELLVEAKKIVSTQLKSLAQDALQIINQINDMPEIKAENYLRTGKLPENISFTLKGN